MRRSPIREHLNSDFGRLVGRLLTSPTAFGIALSGRGRSGRHAPIFGKSAQRSVSYVALFARIRYPQARHWYLCGPSPPLTRMKESHHPQRPSQLPLKLVRKTSTEFLFWPRVPGGFWQAICTLGSVPIHSLAYMCKSAKLQGSWITDRGGWESLPSGSGSHSGKLGVARTTHHIVTQHS